MSLLYTVFGSIIDFCYNLTGSFGLALIVFTLITRVVLFPISFISHLNSIILLRIQPQTEDIKARNSGEPATILAEQKALYKKERYSTLKALLPMVVQIIIVLGVIGAVNAAIADAKYDFAFWGLDLSELPSLTSVYAVIPILSAVSAFFLCFTQNMLNPLARTQGFAGKWGTAIFLTVFSGYFALVCQAGIGFYWILGNILGIVITVLCVIVYPPKKHVDVNSFVRKPKLTPQEKAEKRQRKLAEAVREREDLARFYGAGDKKLVFYSEASGFYKYFKGYIEYVLDNSDIVVHYVTSDLNDRVFDIKRERFETYFCGGNGLITLFMKMECDMFVMTMPDLQKYHYKRSLVKKDIEYIYTDHGFGSVNFLLRKGALNHFDTIFCGGKSYNEEIRAMERVYGLPEKKLVDVGFGLFDEMRATCSALEVQRRDKPQILIAPSWQKDNILELCVDELVADLDLDRYHAVIRPHPEFIKRFPRKMEAMVARLGGVVEIQTDFSSSSTVYLSDLLITDWSTIAQEFSFTTGKPSLFINTPMKIMNPEWERVAESVQPIDIRLRDEIGKSLDVDKLGELNTVVSELIASDYSERIQRVFEESVYNIGDSARVGGGYIIDRFAVKEQVNE
jgi:YidC/Oxa1 family membrane protein insertase